MKFNADEMYPRGTTSRSLKMDKYNFNISVIKSNLQLLKEVQPVMTNIAQWTQALANLSIVTSSKVLIARKDISASVDQMKARVKVISSPDTCILLCVKITLTHSLF